MVNHMQMMRQDYAVTDFNLKAQNKQRKMLP